MKSDEIHDTLDIENIARRWYTEQRGRIVGNTVAWDELPMNQQLDIIDQVMSLLNYMRKAWKR